MTKTLPHTDLTRHDRISNSLAYPEYEEFAQEKRGEKLLYCYCGEAGTSDDGRKLIWISFGTYSPNYRNVHLKGYSHGCKVFRSGFKIVKRPKGTRPHK